MVITKNSSVAMYEQIADVLKNEILLHKYEEDGNIGTQSDLAKRFEVSLITIRKAISILAEEDILVIKQGKGTFVKNTIIKDNARKLTGVTNMMHIHNIKPIVSVLSMEKIKPIEHPNCEELSELGEECYYIERVHKVDDAVVGYAKLYLPIEYGIQLSENDIVNNTIYELYENKFNLELGKGIQRIKATKADKKSSKLMGVKEDWPLLQIDRKSYSKDKKLIEYMELLYEYTQYSFEMELNLSSV